MTPAKSNPEKPRPAARKGAGSLQIQGSLRLEQAETPPEDLQLRAYAFDANGELIGSGDVDAKGGFNFPVRLEQPADVELFVGPATEDLQQLRQSSAYNQGFTAKDWAKVKDRYVLNPQIYLPGYIWWPWRPVRICVTGHVRKVEHIDEHTEICPVPFVKVEIFDVDREACWWPYIRLRWKDLLDQRVFRIPELIKELPHPPEPIPGPDPAPFMQARINPAAAPDNPLPTSGGASEMSLDATQMSMASSPQAAMNLTAGTRVGEMKDLSPEIATRFENLTLSSKVAPWLIFPYCFYSKELVCETTTDCNGYFRCCFTWWPFHFRNGRLRFDFRPDIIIRVTQVINGVETVVYLDPYTSTRWNVTNAHIDLFLDNEEVQCGSGCHPQPVGPDTFFTLIGRDEVYKIEQAGGTFNNTAYGGSLSNWAYGSNLLVCGLFGDALSTGAPKRYYRISYAKKTNPAATPPDSAFKPVTSGMSDTRVDKSTHFSELYTLGPQTVNGVPNLYEVRNTANFYWYNPDKLIYWNTMGPEGEPDTGLYVLRLEVFNELGVKQTSAVVNYLDGTAGPGSVLPSMVDHCDLNIRIDNRAPDLNISVPAASSDCGVVPCNVAASMTIDASINQVHNRLYRWRLDYEKGLSGALHWLDGNISGSGITPLPATSSGVTGAPLVSGLSGTCAFGLLLRAWPLIRNGYGVVHYKQLVKSIVIEGCP
ncbi:MAG: hypothetical protein P8Z00_06065 [Anaerolineales bacterium]|jgi:hypothetical protein